MLYPSLPMGTESYYIYIKEENEDITAEDFSSFNGKRVGVNKGSVQEGFLVQWARENHVTPQLVPLSNVSVEESLEMLNQGELDAYATLDTFGEKSACIPVCKIGFSDYYFTVSKDRPDLLTELNEALSQIQDEDPYYNQKLFEKYAAVTKTNAFLPTGSLNWLSDHGPVRVGYRDSYLPFCTLDEESGALTGALANYLEQASQCTRNGQAEFEPVPYHTVDDALEALDRGEIDCVFPVNLSPSECEERGLLTTNPVMHTEIYALMRSSDRRGISSEEALSVAVNAGNSNFETFIMDYFPHWRVVECEGTEACFQAVASAQADCMLLSSYRISKTDGLRQRYKLSLLTTGSTMSLSFALPRSSPELYATLSKLVNLIPSSSVDSALMDYSYTETRVTFSDFLRDNWTGVLVIITLFFGLALLLLMERLQAERKSNERQRLISATELDPLTRLYNRSFFFVYADRRFNEHPERPMDAIVLNIEQFHSVNAIKSHAFGDQVLKTMGDELRSFLSQTDGIAGRIEADSFDLYVAHMEDYQGLYDRLQNRLNQLARDVNIRLRMGVMPWQAGLEPVQLFDRARTACSLTRGSYKSRLTIYDEDMRSQELRDQQLINDLRKAVEEEQLVVFYQPKYDIQCNPPRLSSAEALIRWRHPELGMIPPDQFIPLFERNGQIGLVDRYVWTKAAGQIARWREQYGLVLPVSVNLSRIDVFDPDLEETLEALIQNNALEHSALKLEVTESAYTENALQVIEVIERLREKGYEIEMDDFGSGFSSLNMLSSMPIDVLKMDKAFIQNIEHNEKDIRLVELILEIARGLKVPVVAEGVETLSQLSLLRSLGCALVQGYYFSRPLPPEEFESNILSKAADR